MKKIQRKLPIILIVFIILGFSLFSYINKANNEKENVNTLSEANEKNKQNTDNKKSETKENKDNKQQENKDGDSVDKDSSTDNKNSSIGESNKEQNKPEENTNNKKEGVEISGADVEAYLNGSKNDDKKYVFLTFDDGPTEETTPKILKILNNNNVNGTFFLVGSSVDKSTVNKDLVKQIYNNGNAIGNHTYYHDYKKIYPNNSIDTKKFMDEVDKTNTSLKNVLGKDFNTQIVRMPGGEMSRRYYKDPHLPNLKNEFEKRKIYSIDWNSLNGDAEGKEYTVEQMINYVKQTSKGKNKVVILMHDSNGKGKTIKALPAIIEYFKDNGYEFKTIKS